MTRDVSVVVPAQNEQASIAALLDSLLAQTHPAAEIIVVDAGSVDRTAEIVREYHAAAVPVRLVSSGSAFPGIARNIGVATAASEYIALTDAGIRLDPRWLEKLCAALGEAARPDVVFGSYQPVTPSFFSQCAATAYVPARSAEKGEEIRGPSIASCLLRKSLFHATGGFPPYRAAEDLMFLEQIRREPWSIAYAPEAIAHWELAAGWRSTYRRFALYSYHNLIAGRGRYWHYGAARFYVLAAPFLILGCVNGTAWFLVPLLGGCARIGVALWRKRNEHWGAACNPLRWMVVGMILMLLDAATLSGALRWTRDRLLGRLRRQDATNGELSRQGKPA